MGMNQGWTYRERVDRAGAGQTILAYYTERYRHSNQQEWRERIDSGQILLEGQQVGAETCLRLGQKLIYQRPPWQEPMVPLTFEVLYEDLDLLVAAKPAGLPVMPGGGFLEHTLLWRLRLRYPQETPTPIHRLGRGTSGLMLLARSQSARSRLSRQMRDRQISKTYRALVQGVDLPEEFTIRTPIGKLPHPVLGYVYGPKPDGLFALSHGQVLRRNANTTLVEVNILTGRPHQIRIHLAAAGYPLVGDPLYQVGGKPRQPSVHPGANPRLTEKLPVPGDCGYYLHAYQLRFNHPTTEQPMQMECPVPAELS